MDELQQLMQQRKELDQKIRQLRKNYPVICGKAKLDKESYPTDKPDRWMIAINCKPKDPPAKGSPWAKESIWRTIINGDNRQECAEAIPGIIKDLQTLYDSIREAEKNG